MLGLIGGLSDVSTQLYYQGLNKLAKTPDSPLASFPVIINALNFQTGANMMHQNQWPELADLLITAAQQLEKAGVSHIAICCNSAHEVFDQVQAAIGVPIIHIAEPVSKKISEMGLKNILLLGNHYTMQFEFYKNYIEKHTSSTVYTPSKLVMDYVHRVIYEELCTAKVDEVKQAHFREVLQKDILSLNLNIDGIILGCTELCTIMKQPCYEQSLLDSTMLHIENLYLLHKLHHT